MSPAFIAPTILAAFVAALIGLGIADSRQPSCVIKERLSFGGDLYLYQVCYGGVTGGELSSHRVGQGS